MWNKVEEDVQQNESRDVYSSIQVCIELLSMRFIELTLTVDSLIRDEIQVERWFNYGLMSRSHCLAQDINCAINIRYFCVDCPVTYQLHVRSH